MGKTSELVLLIPLFPILLLGKLPMLVFPLLGLAGLGVIGGLMIACGFAEYLRATTEHNEHTIVRGDLARSDQAPLSIVVEVRFALGQRPERDWDLHSLHRHRRFLLELARWFFYRQRLRRSSRQF